MISIGVILLLVMAAFSDSVDVPGLEAGDLSFERNCIGSVYGSAREGCWQEYGVHRLSAICLHSLDEDRSVERSDFSQNQNLKQLLYQYLCVNIYIEKFKRL